MTILAAGAILWREDKGQLLVALIHRSRHNDWSWPKGKVDPGELLPETAVREIAEETGLAIKLGPLLKIVKYKIPSGAPKEVFYWAAKVTPAILAKSKFQPSEEVAKVDWKTPEEARALLTYEFDSQVLDELMAIYKRGQIRTRPLIILRHATATPRAAWKGGKGLDDGHRPLLPEGAVEAKKLIKLLDAFAPKRVITSPWSRCLNTVAPYANKRKLKIIERSQLSEFGNKKGPKRTKNVVLDVIEEGQSAVICSHRPALPTIFDTIKKYSPETKFDLLDQGPALKPAEMTVIHMTTSDSKKKRKIVSVERYGVI
jgi:8-oxo-dGTP pyrophosphatase MutT (NUDIX family)/broad specificity phosphatase PhoE